MGFTWKILFYVGVFSLLHFGYELTGWAALIPFFGVDESVFEHLKMAFFSYFLTSTFEYFLTKKKNKGENFWFSRILSNISIPWLILTIWYILPAIFGKIESVAIELIWAFFVVFLSAFFGITFEKTVEQAKPRMTAQITVLIVFLVCVFFFVRFSFSKPWIDVFIDPHTI